MKINSSICRLIRSSNGLTTIQILRHAENIYHSSSQRSSSVSPNDHRKTTSPINHATQEAEIIDEMPTDLSKTDNNSSPFYK